jgi:hypothetical protein
MKIRITTPIIAVLIGTALVITGFGPTKISLINETFGGGVSGNRTNATNTAALLGRGIHAKMNLTTFGLSY